jgi:predicted outer membrane repeat protein
MDLKQFDDLAKYLSTVGTRRGLLRLLATMPVAGGLLALLAGAAAQGQGGGAVVGGGGGRRRRRKARHRHDPGDGKTNRKGKRKRKRSCARVGQTPKTGTRKGCCAGLSEDATGRCAAPTPPPPSQPCAGLKPTDDLQAAINAAAPGATLTLCPGTWLLSATLVIAKNLMLIGAGTGQSILDGGIAVRVLQIGSGATVTVQDLTITKGRAAGTTVPTGFGGGIFNEGTLTLRGVAVTGNSATQGGGIYSSAGTLTLESGSIVGGTNPGDGNTAGDAGGGIFNDGGTLTLAAGSRVTGNHAFVGGGIFSGGGPVTLQAGAIVCSNSEPQCAGPGTINGTCPSPSPICPP